MSVSFLRQLLMKEAVKKSAGSSGIMTINKNIAADVDKLLQKYINDALAQGVDLDTLSPEQLKMIVAMNSKANARQVLDHTKANARQIEKLGEAIPADSLEGKAITEKLFGKKGEVVDMTGKKIDTSQGIMGGKSVKELMESGQVQKGTDNIIISDKITNREMFKNSNLNKEPVSEKFIDYTIQDINKKEPIEGMKIANKIIKREGEFKDLTEAQSKRILKETDDHLTGKDMDYDPEDFYFKGGRAGFYTGGITDVEPSLDDIGHGSDSLMSRTRLMSPGAQATTSTGLNYLLAEDNDNLRIPFSTGKLAGGIDSAIEKNKNLENMIALIEAKNKRLIDQGIKNAPEGVLMDPPPKKNDILSLGEEGTELNSMRDPRTLKRPSDLQSNTIIFDDGTIYYKDTDEYYREDGSQVSGPSPGAKLIVPTMEAAEGGRIGFSAGGGGRRAFLKFLASIGGLTAAAKSGMIGLGEGGAKKAVTETVKQSAGNYPPPYFFKLVEKIKFMGDDITEKAATKDREIVKRYKDFEMSEDVATGQIVIKKRNEGSFYDQDGIISDEYIVYKPGQADEMTKGKKPPPEYEEYTVRPDAEGKLRDSEGGLDSIDEILEEVGDTTAMTLKKADGGRIGYVGGGLSKLGITGSSRKFLEKVFGKEKFKNLIENDPELHRGMLEVAEMFRSKDKAGLVEYMQNFLPKMSKKELEAFVVGSGDAAGIEGQLIRLGSGRDYKNKIEMIEEANNLRKLKDFDVEDVSKNAEGGRIGFSGGGIYRAIIARSAAKAGMKPYEYIKKTSYKSLPPEVKMFMSPEDFARLKMGQEQMYSNYIDMAKTRLNFQKEVEGGKKTPARELFEGMEKTMDEQSYVPKNVNEKDIGEMEIMFRNRFLKDRKPNSSGGLQTMLGE